MTVATIPPSSPIAFASTRAHEQEPDVLAPVVIPSPAAAPALVGRPLQPI